MKGRQVLLAASFILVCELVGVLGAVFTIPAVSTWYAVLKKPWFTPPGWAFGPVWLILYALMGISAYLVWKNRGHKKLMPFAKSAFCWQLSFNLCWPLFFFGLGELGKGLVDIILLWVALVITTALFYRISKKAALLLVPYIIWVTIALALNFYVWKLN
jgi:tryptophan-rich sensory protein